MAAQVTGPYEKYEGNPLFAGHAFSAWVHRDGVEALCGVVSPSVLWSEDGLHFTEAGTMPNYSTGFYCPENFRNGTNFCGATWGLDCHAVDGRRGLHRIDCMLDVKEHDMPNMQDNSYDTETCGGKNEETTAVDHINLERTVDTDSPKL